MKKLISLTLILTMLLALFSSCNQNTEKPSNTSTGEQTETNTDTVTNTDTGTNTNGPALPYEKYGNKVYFAFEEKANIYYSEITSYEEITDCFEIPVDEIGLLKSGAYLKFISTYEELLTYITPFELEPSIFDENYVICIKQLFYDKKNEKSFIGYYDLKKQDNQYSICLDHYESVENAEKADISYPNEYTNYIIVPKQSVEHVEHVQKITVNGKNDIQDEFSVPISHLYIKHKTQFDLFVPTSWVVEKGSNLEKQYGFEYYNKYSDIQYRVILYLPNEPERDFIITEKVIKNGNLYLTVELYEQHTNKYLSKNDVKFYDLYIKDSSELSENYDVYILVKTIK